jgi:hypothetical protein
LPNGLASPGRLVCTPPAAGSGNAIYPDLVRR